MTASSHNRPAAYTPIALTIAGSDSSGGAGIQADLKTFAAFGVYGASVITALTAQNTRGVTGVLATPPAFITAQLDAVAADLAVTAIKTGMLGTREAVEAVCAGVLRHRLGPLIVDPVMVATSGDVLLADDAIEAVRTRLIPLATLVTPNLHEAAALLETTLAATVTEMESQARALQARCQARAVLIKGGHSTGTDAADVLVDAAGVTHLLTLPRLRVSNTHGTGCTLSAAITALMASGVALPEAVTRAKRYVWRALAAGHALQIGHGNGPVDHLYAQRSDPPPDRR
jgi:hydroxymethylpyrimidine/phosphomethylpyrimidine kinase